MIELFADELRDKRERIWEKMAWSEIYWQTRKNRAPEFSMTQIIIDILNFFYIFHGAGVAQSLTRDRAIEVRSPVEVTDFSSSLCAQTSSEAHPASYPVGTGVLPPEGKARALRNVYPLRQFVPRLRKSRSYSSSTIVPYMAVAGQLYFLHISLRNSFYIPVVQYLVYPDPHTSYFQLNLLQYVIL
jgi:hypothetical protein